MENDATYIGNELELFSHAKNWKKYWGNQTRPFLGENVLEVGAGLGGTTVDLIDTATVKKWVCLEPDTRLSSQIKDTLKGHPDAGKVEVQSVYLADYKTDQKFNSILYIDVIEHIEHEAEELQRAYELLKDNGYLIIVVPAHQSLYSPFDKSIGHFRRYNRKMLHKVLPGNLQVVQDRYLDSEGLMATLANKKLLKQSYPTIKQIKYWDSAIIPFSRICDKIFQFNVGKSILLIGKKKPVL